MAVQDIRRYTWIIMKPLGQQNYEQFARRYAQAAESKPHNAHYERPATLSLLPDVDGLRVLDAGCGPGIYTAWLLDHGATVVACDVTPDFLEIARERTGNQAAFHQADLSQPLTFAAESEFDLVICPLVLDYIADWGPTFAEFYRVLKPDGTLVFSCGHPATDYFVYANTGSYFDVELTEMTWNGFGEPPPVVRSYRRPLGAALNPLIAAGFRLDHVLEPRPTSTFGEISPKDYALLMRQPGFLCIRAHK
jgi:SAM-dependent methyltransferase